MVFESHRTHGIKTTMRSFTDSCTTICAPRFVCPPRQLFPHSLTRLSLSVYTVIQNTTPTHTVSHPAPPPIGTTPTHPPRPARLRVTVLPRACCMSFPPRLLFITFNTHPRQRPLPRSALHTPTNTQISRNFAHMSFCVSVFRFPRSAFLLYPPRHHRPQASGCQVY